MLRPKSGNAAITKLLVLIGLTLATSIACQDNSAVYSSDMQSTPRNTNAGAAAVDSRPDLLPSSRAPIPDLPVPLNFKMVEDISRNYESAGARFIDHTYAGYADRVDVARFYRKRMAQNGWKLRSSQMVRGEYLLRFEKADELCEVSIASSSNFGRERTTVNINVQTLGQGAMQSDTSKPKR